MRALIRNLMLILTVIVVCIWSIIPPDKKLRLGKDLRGGVSLIYSVQIKPGDPPDVISRVIDVLKQRVDPNGLSEISIAQQGRDRIEITMPLPSKRVKLLKEAYDAELAKLGAMSLDAAAFERLMRLEGPARGTEIQRVAAGDQKRLTALTAASAAEDVMKAARAELNQAQADLKTAKDTGAEQARLDELTKKVDGFVEKVAAADLDYEAKRAACLGAVLSPVDVRLALEQSNQPRSLIDSTTGQQIKLPSPREAAIERLMTQHPDFKDQINAIIAAHARYASERTQLDDSADLKRLLAGAGVLDFRITVGPGEHPQESRLRREIHERGPQNVQSTDARWFKVNKIDTWMDRTSDIQSLKASASAYFASKFNLTAEDYNGEFYVLCWDVAGSRLTRAEGDWAVAAAYQSTDPQSGLPAISFEMNNRGAALLNDLTKQNVGKHMAVLLDDQVYTAPSLRSKIGRSGQITGSFSDAELRYIIRVLAAGSLQAKLSPEPISEVTLAPELGADNLAAGVRAGVISLIVIGGFMIVYYFGCGVIAVIALLVNALMILGLMSLNRAAFTMPGIAGVILTFGMAVDANVLVYERMREEIQRGVDLRNAVRLGFNKAMSSIVDGNVTNLIHCVVLYFVGTQEIKGFAITMAIGVITTLFAALVVSRVIFTMLVDFGPWQRASMLPLVIPGIDRFFHRNIDWLRLRWVFWGFSTAYVVLGLCMVFFRGSDMLDTQFRGGTQIVMQLKLGADEKPVTKTRRDIEEKLKEIGANASAGDEQLHRLAASSVLPVNPQSDGVTSDQFVVKSLATDATTVRNAIAEKFGDLLETQPALEFKGVRADTLKSAPVYQIVSPTLGEDLARPEFRDDVKSYLGGVAIVVEDIQPPQPLAEIKKRLERTRTTTEFSDTLVRQRNVIILEGDERAVKAAAIVVRDPAISVFDDEQRWSVEVESREWKLTRDALSVSSTAASVEVFSPTIARTFTAQAIVAFVLGFILIGIYIWVRFGSVSFALGGIIPLVHDVLTAIGFIAVAQLLHENPTTSSFAHKLGILPFKIDLNMVASLLTVMGYSLNDSIIVMDRIRENRGKRHYATKEMINNAVNMTISRTVITSGTVLMASVVLYLVGGEGMRGFSYALVIGVLTGTYSSIALTAPLVWSRKADRPHSEPPQGGAGATPPALVEV